MVDDRPHLDLIEGSIGGGPARVRLCLDVDAGWWPLGGRMARVGPKRSPIHEPRRAAQMAAEIAERPGHRARRADGLRGPDRRGWRRRPRPPAAKHRNPRHAEGVRARAAAPLAGGRRGRQTQPSPSTTRRRSASSTAAAPAASRAPQRPASSPSSPPARASTPPPSSTPTARSTSPRRRCSACRWCAGRSAAWQRCSAAAISPRAPAARRACPSPTSPAACASTAKRAPARSRRR